MSKFWSHFCTITKHRWQVRKGCFKVGLYRQGLVHDLSKYSPTEFWVGVRVVKETEAPTTPKEKIKDIHQPGFTTKAGINIITSTGSITIPTAINPERI